ncbi:MAG TPA: hydrogenase/urease maturation nickel metallochaperone HypA [Acidimicrobiia bacterium]|nr:hydrogenase/urease maturation nickel metallochaperone HypA [Acidimicrobiia bacterium]
MHESHTAWDLVRAAGMTALDEGSGRIVAMKVRIGSLSHIDPDALRHQIEWHAKGTMVEGARIEVEPGPPFSADHPDRHASEVVLVSVDVGR